MKGRALFITKTHEVRGEGADAGVVRHIEEDWEARLPRLNKVRRHRFAVLRRSISDNR